MSLPGRPLRFLVGLMGLWVGGRVVQTWPEPPPAPSLIATAVAPPSEAAVRGAVPTSSVPELTPAAPSAVARTTVFTRPVRHATPLFSLQPALSVVEQAQPARADDVQRSPPGGIAAPIAPMPVITPLPPRLAGSGWLIVRGGGEATPFAPQLGGSQAGIRLTYAIDGARRLSLAGRVSSALGSRQREAAVGLDWRPTALPIHLVAEQRIGIEGARGGPALGLIGGIGPTPVIGGLRLDAYAQGGAIARDGVEGFVDGAVRVAHPVAAIGPARIELGLGAWGGAQRGAARVDAGPAAALALSLAGRSLRLSLEWRQRLAGRAAPASGPAFSLGTDF